MNNSDDRKLIDFVFGRDPTLPHDLECYRSGDVHRLLRRLDAVYRDSLNSPETWSTAQIHQLLNALVKCYIDTAQSIKVARAVEKIWQPYLGEYRDYINSCLESLVILVINTQQTDSNQIAKASVLLEQNKLVQEVFCKNLDKVIVWLSAELSTLLTLSPCALTPVQTKCLHGLVKISLQLFQVCSEELGSRLWVEKDVARNQDVKILIESFISILQNEGYQTDCVLLCGTATALMLNSCRQEDRAVQSFHRLLYQVLYSDSVFEMKYLDEELNQDIIQQRNDRILTKLKTLMSKTLGPVALIRGVVSCCSTDVLFSVSSDSSCLFQELFHHISTLCQGDITLHYQAFQILLLWYTRLTKFPSKIESTISLSHCTSILESTWNLVMLNWDSPVEDVPEAVVEIFSYMMSVWETIKGSMPTFPEKILQILLKTQWYVKGKYRVLAALLKFVDAQKVIEENTEILAQLQQCLTTNHLASSATNVYKAFLQLMNKNAVDEWRKLWLPKVVDGMVSDNSLLRYNTSLHWVPVTFKLVPDTATVLQDHLSALMEGPGSPLCRIRLLYAWIIVAKTIRMLTGRSDLAHVNVKEALYSADEDVRAEAIALVCTTLKKAECLSTIEAELLRECLPYNIKIDSAPFRQHLGSDIRKLLVRLRDSCVTMLKSPVQNKDKLDCALDFVDWLHKLCIEFLLPGACYQRRKGSLDLLHVIYESLIYSSSSKQRKGYVPESTVALVDFALSIKRWDFFCSESTQALILCLLDGADEIQTSAYLLLNRYYKMTLEDNLGTPNDLCCHLLAEGLTLCNSPKGHEGQSGAILCKLVFQKYVIEHKASFSIQYSTDSGYSVSVIKNTENNNAVVYLQALLAEVTRCMVESEKDLVKASKQYPIHGLISAVTQCLTDVNDLWLTPPPDLIKVSQKLVEVCQQIIEKMLHIMAGVAGQESCPSFAEIGMALENLLLENQSEYEESTSLSPEYQYMLSWCWNNIKESCLSLGEITRVTTMSRSHLPLAVVESMNTTFHMVLTKCRHKGVIEGCRSAYIKFCSALFHCIEEAVLAIPAGALTEVLSSLKKRSILSSVTRRSAGLPIIIQAVLVSEKKIKKTLLLTQAVSSLFEICELPLDEDLGVTDLPQVHGLNILNSLFSDASLTASLIGQTGHAVILVIQQFGSPSWAIRNAATRFFSTLVTRIFGQKKSKGEKFCNSVTFLEFSSYYPELPPFILKILEEASKRDIKDISQIHPGLFPVLTLLSCLKPIDTVDEDIARQQKEYFNFVEPFTGSPVYQLRNLVASALVAMVPPQEMTSSVISCLRDHVTRMETSVVCYNTLHGYLLFVHGLLDYIERTEDLELLWTLLTQQLWLITLNNGLVSAVYMNILHRLLVDCPTVMVDEILEIVTLEHCVKGSRQIVGNNVFCEAAVEFMFESYNRNQVCIYGLVDKLLTFHNVEARKTCLEKLPKFLERPGKNKQYNKMAVLAILCNCVRKEKQFMNTVLKLIATLYEDLGTIHKDDLLNLVDWFSSVNIEESRKSDSSLVSVVPVWAILVKHEIEAGNSVTHDLRALLKVVHRFSRAVNEDQRFTAVRVLKLVGKHLLNVARTTSQAWLISLLEASVTLIQDEDTEIRFEACKYLSSLQWEGKPTQFSSYHSNVCYELFLQYLSDNFWQCPRCIQFLYSHLSSATSLQSHLEERATTKYLQLFDQEDNSFFAEKIYNAFSVHKFLKIMLRRCLNEKMEVVGEWIKYVPLNCIEEQLLYLQTVLSSIPKGSYISVASDNIILSSICELLFSCDIVAMVTDCVLIGETARKIAQSKALPKVFRRTLQQIFTAS